MNLNYLTEEIMPQREAEIEAGKNLGTAHPIYAVIDLDYNYIGGHDVEGWLSGSSLISKNKDKELGYLDLAEDLEDREFSESSEGMVSPDKVTKIYTDNIIAFFLTKKGAKEYLEYQAHNLSDEAFIYVFNPGYSNHELKTLFKKP